MKRVETFKIIERKWIWFGISLAIIAVGLISLVLHGFNWGIDFTGGNILHYDIRQSYDLQEVRDTLGTFDVQKEAKKAGDNGQQLIVRTGALTKEEQSDITDALSQKWPEIELIQSESIDPVIGRELQKQAITALLIANLGMLAYITFRFEFKSALAAVMALLHDIAIVLSFYAIFFVPIDSTFIAVILTIVGVMLACGIVGEFERAL